MNYDLTLYISKLGVPDLEEAEQLEEAAINDEYVQQMSDKFEDTESIPDEISVGPLVSEMTRELNLEEPEIASPERIVLHIPYGKRGDDAENLFAEINTYLQGIAEHGYFVYDPQANRAFDPRETVFDWADVYEKGADLIDDISAEEFES